VLRNDRERQDSVFNGLMAASPDASLVAIHDAARPLVTSAEVTPASFRIMSHHPRRSLVAIHDAARPSS
jgi:2-C-methyl-D-erythritol 4-phosphate cytidylyltransferase